MPGFGFYLCWSLALTGTSLLIRSPLRNGLCSGLSSARWGYVFLGVQVRENTSGLRNAPSSMSGDRSHVSWLYGCLNLFHDGSARGGGLFDVIEGLSF